MDQIAISREITFRAVGEGTGKELDSDRFDPYYWHLWVWDDEAGEMVGGYRLGKTNEIVDSHGLDKLYSRSLYHYDQQFIDRQGGTVEVGRSFISPAYQRHPKVLDLMWRGIGSFMVANPHYHTLFGCVSVSQQYSQLARAFLADTLLENFSANQELKQSVTPSVPFEVKAKPWSELALKDFAEIPVINKLLGRIDSGKHIPVLIRHYLALEGRFISFTVNEGFNHSLDGLLIVDLRQTPNKYVNRYLGKEGAKLFNARWKSYESAA
ncbi:MAG: putative hemolysin [Alteromonadaceae bacterium]|jgi:putative hemolysin